MIDVSVIILNRDKPELIGPCLESIFTHTNNLRFEVLVGDTGTSDDNCKQIYSKYLESYPSNFKVINAGKYQFSKSNNLVSKSALGRYFVFLNNDTVLLDNALKAMFDFAANNPSVGVLGPKLLFGHNYRIQHAGIEFFISPYHGLLGFHPGAGRHSSLKEYSAIKIVPAVTGACLMVSAKDFELVQGFDENYNAEAQDVDLCLKISSLGKHVVYNGQIELIHLENGSRPPGEENRQDRKLLTKKWKSKISKEFIKGPYQFRYFDNSKQIDFSSREKVLIVRQKARGDVLACLRICESLKKSTPNIHISFRTDFPDLIDASPLVDRVLATGEVDTWTYNRVLSPNYEDGQWQEGKTWIEQMYSSISLDPIISDHTLELNFSEFDSISTAIDLRGLPESYVIASTGAGWPEREWSASGWTELTKKLSSQKISIVQIGGENDYQIPGAVLKLNKSIQTNLRLVQKSLGVVTLDSYPLHIAMMTEKPIVVLTCKTCGDTVRFSNRTLELRNTLAKQTPFDHCKTKGCRLRYGNGLENSCSTPILKTLDSDVVFETVMTHFKISGDKNGL